MYALDATGGPIGPPRTFWVRSAGRFSLDVRPGRYRIGGTLRPANWPNPQGTSVEVDAGPGACVVVHLVVIPYLP